MHRVWLHRACAPPSPCKRAQYFGRRSIVACCSMGSGRSALHPDISTVLFSESEIAARCVDLGAEIAAAYVDKQPLVLVTLSGAYMFAAELLKRVQPPPRGLQVDFIRASSYGAATQSSGTVALEVCCSMMARSMLCCTSVAHQPLRLHSKHCLDTSLHAMPLCWLPPRMRLAAPDTLCFVWLHAADRSRPADHV